MRIQKELIIVAVESEPQVFKAILAAIIQQFITTQQKLAYLLSLRIHLISTLQEPI
jgi:hypothetical protein